MKGQAEEAYTLQPVAQLGLPDILGYIARNTPFSRSCCTHHLS